MWRKLVSVLVLFFFVFSMLSPAFAGEISNYKTTEMIPTEAVKLTYGQVPDPSAMDVFLNNYATRKYQSFYGDWEYNDVIDDYWPKYWYVPDDAAIGRVIRDEGSGINMQRTSYLSASYLSNYLKTTGFTEKEDFGDLSFVNWMLKDKTNPKLWIIGSGSGVSGELAEKFTTFNGLEALTNITDLEITAYQFPKVYNLSQIAQLPKLKVLDVRLRHDQYFPELSLNSTSGVKQPIEDITVRRQGGETLKPINPIYPKLESYALEEDSSLKNLSIFNTLESVHDLSILHEASKLEALEFDGVGYVFSLETEKLPDTLKSLKISPYSTFRGTLPSKAPFLINATNFEALGDIPDSLEELTLEYSGISKVKADEFRAKFPDVTLKVLYSETPFVTQEHPEGNFNVRTSGVATGTPVDKYTLGIPSGDLEAQGYELEHNSSGVPTITGELSFEDIFKMYKPHKRQLKHYDGAPFFDIPDFEMEYIPLTGSLEVNTKSSTTGTGVYSQMQLKRLGENRSRTINSNGSGNFNIDGLLFGEYVGVVYGPFGKYEPQYFDFTITVDDRKHKQDFSLVYDEDIGYSDTPILAGGSPSKEYANVKIFYDGEEVTVTKGAEIKWTTAAQNKTIIFEFEGWSVTRPLKIPAIPTVTVPIEHITPGGKVLGTESKSGVPLYSITTFTTSRTYTGYNRLNSSLQSYVPDQNFVLQFTHEPNFKVTIKHKVYGTDEELHSYEYSGVELAPSKFQDIDYDGLTFDDYVFYQPLKVSVRPLANQTVDAVFYHLPSKVDSVVEYRTSYGNYLIKSEPIELFLGVEKTFTVSDDDVELLRDGQPYRLSGGKTQTVTPEVKIYNSYNPPPKIIFTYDFVPYVEVIFKDTDTWTTLKEQRFEDLAVGSYVVTNSLEAPSGDYEDYIPLRFDLSDGVFEGYELVSDFWQGVTIGTSTNSVMRVYVSVPKIPTGEVRITCMDILNYAQLDVEVITDLPLDIPYTITAKSFDGYVLVGDSSEVYTPTRDDLVKHWYFDYVPEAHVKVQVIDKDEHGNILQTYPLQYQAFADPVYVNSYGNYPGKVLVGDWTQTFHPTVYGETITATFVYKDLLGSFFSGMVLDEEGMMLGGGTYEVVGYPELSGVVDDWGYFYITDLPIGTYTIKVKKSGYVPDEQVVIISQVGGYEWAQFTLSVDTTPPTTSSTLVVEHRDFVTNQLLDTPTTLNLTINEDHTIAAGAFVGYKLRGTSSQTVRFNNPGETQTMVFYYDPIVSGDWLVTVLDESGQQTTAKAKYKLVSDSDYTVESVIGEFTKYGALFGDYELVIEKEGYLSQTFNFTTNLTTPNFTQTVSLLVDPNASTPPTVTKGDFKLTVLDEEGNLADASVVYSKSGGIATTTATVGGELTVSDLDFGVYTVKVSKAGYKSKTLGFVLASDKLLENLIVQLVKEAGVPPVKPGTGGTGGDPEKPELPIKLGYLTVSVVNPKTGAALSGVEVRVIYQGDLREVITGRDGRVTFNGLERGAKAVVMVKMGDGYQVALQDIK